MQTPEVQQTCKYPLPDIIDPCAAPTKDTLEPQDRSIADVTEHAMDFAFVTVTDLGEFKKAGARRQIHQHISNQVWKVRNKT
jgi:hypothetical protein